ncbi:MAG TPA: hemolysin family protein [Bacteroidales bacterium]|nr:hemolysin family protein [Bacteroidales bacterium]
MSPVIIIILSLIFSAFFSGMEIAFVSSNRLKTELDRKHGLFSSKIIAIFIKSPGHYIATMLVGNNIALVIYGIVVAHLLEPFLQNKIGINNEIAVLVIQTIVGTLVILFTAEFLPKTIFRSRPNLTLNIFSVPVLVFYIILYPITVFTLGITNFIMRFFMGIKVKTRNSHHNPVFGRIDLDHLISESQSEVEKSLEDEPEKKIFQNALEFSRLKVRDCMVPRTEIEALEINSPVAELKQRFVETGYSKILIFEDSIDRIVGYVSSKDMFKHPASIRSKLVSLSIVPETMQVNKLFRKLIRERKSIALVVDEYGGTSGIVTLEDIIEEIFGEIEDEHDISEFVERPINENEFILSGRLEIDYLNEKYKLDIPVSDDYDTLAGLIIHHHENIPRLNTRVIIMPYQYRILKVSQTRIELVYVKRLTES